MWTWVPGT
jgi:hypothetical protein